MNQFFSTNEVSVMFQVTTRTVQNWRDQGLIGFIKVRGKILFTSEHIEAFVKANEYLPFKSESLFTNQR